MLKQRNFGFHTTDPHPSHLGWSVTLKAIPKMMS